jgi:cyclohexa-1,5-dienecarbonyl-CoA hydratase
MSSPIRCSEERSAQVQRIVLDRPKANILDREMVEAIRGRLRELSANPGPLKLVVFEGAGEHFSFGASVEEHMPGRIEEVLPVFHQLFRDLEALGVPTAAVVRGQCLGGGFELALWCGFIVCEPSAKLGVPEIKLGVFPPVAAIALPWRVPGARATQVMLSGDTYDGPGAAAWGLVDRCTNDAGSALLQWFDERLAGKSAVAVRMAWRASRRLLTRFLAVDLPEVEKLYLKELMAHDDPVEGMKAFLERRAPAWKDA